MSRHWWLLVAVFGTLGVSTLVPAPASKPCLLGYFAHCSITPVSTIICWAIAGAFYWVKMRGERRVPKA
ncbi:MAG: hypothetical protein QFX35_06975 [Candidatus Verstraetearchaeota archaeon]|nr:hypothetical protein [Candidatus Verstraetearchaeota archaeon]